MWEYRCINSPELYHHGVMGMKWGVRRYQNEDGSLTPRGEQRFRTVAINEKVAKRQTKIAGKTISKTIHDADVNASLNKQRKEKMLDKSDKFIRKSEAKQAKGDQAGFHKYQSKAQKNMEKSIIAGRNQKIFEARSNFLKTKFNDLESGTLKAGRDFIVQKDIDMYVLPGVMMATVTNTVIEKK